MIPYKNNQFPAEELPGLDRFIFLMILFRNLSILMSRWVWGVLEVQSAGSGEVLRKRSI